MFFIFQELRGSPALEDALKQFKYVSRQYAYFYRKFQSMILRDYFTFDEYRWAVSTVMTRQNQVSSILRLLKSVYYKKSVLHNFCIYSEKSTKIWKNITISFDVILQVQKKLGFFCLNFFLAFSEYVNFNVSVLYSWSSNYLCTFPVIANESVC